jgi:hypothetical protein
MSVRPQKITLVQTEGNEWLASSTDGTTRTGSSRQDALRRLDTALSEH